jgi:hypothetical protein
MKENRTTEQKNYTNFKVSTQTNIKQAATIHLYFSVRESIK